MLFRTRASIYLWLPGFHTFPQEQCLRPYTPVLGKGVQCTFCRAIPEFWLPFAGGPLRIWVGRDKIVTYQRYLQARPTRRGLLKTFRVSRSLSASLLPARKT